MDQPIKIDDTTLSRPGYVLGADDRAGVFLILNHHNKLNWILTRDEETGCNGSRSLAKDEKFIKRVKDFKITAGVVLDRKGTTDIISTWNDYCEDDLLKAVEEVLPTYSRGRGTVCDANQLKGLFPCVNLSVGYSAPHTANETLDLEHLVHLNGRMMKLKTGLSGFKFKPAPKPKPYQNYNTYSSYPHYSPKAAAKPAQELAVPKWWEEPELELEDLAVCGICGYWDGDIEVQGATLCSGCAEQLRNELTRKIESHERRLYDDYR